MPLDGLPQIYRNNTIDHQVKKDSSEHEQQLATYQSHFKAVERTLHQQTKQKNTCQGLGMLASMTVGLALAGASIYQQNHLALLCSIGFLGIGFLQGNAAGRNAVLANLPNLQNIG